MFDFRPVGYVVGLLVLCLGLAMFIPLGLDMYFNDDQWFVFLESALMTCTIGGLVALASSSGVRDRLSIQQTFLLITGVWLALPFFGALPFYFGPSGVSFVDAFFESMSGLTTTGSTILVDIEGLSGGVKLWRGMLQWFGGIGIVVMAMVFLPALRIGGMQIFRSEGFDTFGKILPRAGQIAQSISTIYVALTIMCALAYLASGMTTLDAVVHSFTTIATGGFSNSDSSFLTYGAGAEYVGGIFMILAALPFVRYVQFVSGNAKPLFLDSQIKLFLLTVLTLGVVLSIWYLLQFNELGEETLRKSFFNIISIITGTGYVSADYTLWGSFSIALFFFIGLIGGCAGSTSCSIKIFRFQLLFSSIKSQIQRIHSPHGIFTPRYEGRVIAEDVLSSVVSFFIIFIVSIGVFSIFLGLTGLDFITSISGAATAFANVGPGLGAEIGPSGNFSGLNDIAKWVLAAAMLIGRLELLVIYAILTVNFWKG
ncbi:MAG: TrkH family potassium uptake protein [Proteobacteria bacterium]|nr:TrkH family potassium uptake protein [Pseudomonadota bacterium]